MGSIPLLATEATPGPENTIVPPESLSEATTVLVDSLRGLGEGLLRSLPLIGIALVVVVVGLLAARGASRMTGRGLQRAGGAQEVVNLAMRLVHLLVVVATVLMALSIAGVQVGAVLAGLGIAGLAIAFAMQSILENFVAGIILMLRKPIRHGEQAIIGENEGTVEDIDLRVTRLVDYDGELIIIPNGEVFRSTIVNLTRRGKRRSRVVVRIDYRDDHDAAVAVLEAAASAVPGVLPMPAPIALCVALGDSSVDFELMYWTAPDIASVIDARDGVLRGVKTAIEAAGMTIPWPIRTVSFDNALPHATARSDGEPQVEGAGP